MIALGRPRRWVLLGAIVAGLVGAVIVGIALWPPREGAGPGVAPGPDAAVKRLRPDATTPVEQPPPKAKLTAEEVERLLEWAKRAAEGGRFIAPKGDNAQELIDRIEGDYPEHPQAVALRQQLYGKLKLAAAKAAKRHQYGIAEHRLQAWMALDPLSPKPKQQLFAIYLAQARLALSRGRLKPASDYVKSALALQPKSPAAYEIGGDIAAKKRKWALAVKDYETALEVGDAGKVPKKRIQQKLKLARKKVR